MSARNKLAMFTAEFLGTAILALVVLTVQRSQLGLAFFVALAAGLGVIALTYSLGSVSGGHFNPALTLALWTARRVKTLTALFFITAQLLGAWAAYGLYRYFVNNDVQAIPNELDGRILVAEAIGTMVFALGWAGAAFNRSDTARLSAIAGLSFFLAIVIASAASIGLANPALAVTVRAWEVFGETGWGNYVLGPLLGAVIGINLYGLLFDRTAAPFSGFRGPRFGARSVSSKTTITTVDDDDDDDDEVEVEDVKPVDDKDKTAEPLPDNDNVKKTGSKKAQKKKR